jgi:hypothetical protein
MVHFTGLIGIVGEFVDFNSVEQYEIVSALESLDDQNRPCNLHQFLLCILVRPKTGALNK